MKIAIRCVGAVLALIAVAAPAEQLRFDANIERGKELDPVAIQLALGVKEIPNADTVERVRGKYESVKHQFAGLTPASAEVGVLMVRLRDDAGLWVPPDMGGIGPFVILSYQNQYFAMSETNFARLYSPVTREKLLPYLKGYQSLFGNPFGIVVEQGHVPQLFDEEDKPPKITSVRPTKDGFVVNLVLYTPIHERCFWEENLEVRKDGTVKRKGQKMLKDLGGGIMF